MFLVGAVPFKFVSFVRYPGILFIFIIKMVVSCKSTDFSRSVHGFPLSPSCSLYCVYISLVICRKFNCFVLPISKHSMQLNVFTQQIFIECLSHVKSLFQVPSCTVEEKADSQFCPHETWLLMEDVADKTPRDL